MEINFGSRECNVKIVYYGPGLSGKTTNLEVIHARTPDDNRGKLTALATDQDRTLFFDFMPLELGEIGGLKVRLRLFTVPGQVYYNATRKLVLRCVDGVVFVADSQADKNRENLDSLENLSENLSENGFDLNELPLVLQYNKRDLPNIMTLEQLDLSLNSTLKAPSFPAVAVKGDGVFQCLKAIGNLTMRQVESKIHERSKGKRSRIVKKAPPKEQTPAPQEAPQDMSSKIQSRMHRTGGFVPPGRRRPTGGLNLGQRRPTGPVALQKNPMQDRRPTVVGQEASPDPMKTAGRLSFSVGRSQSQDAQKEKTGQHRTLGQASRSLTPASGQPSIGQQHDTKSGETSGLGLRFRGRGGQDSGTTPVPSSQHTPAAGFRPGMTPPLGMRAARPHITPPTGLKKTSTGTGPSFSYGFKKAPGAKKGAQLFQGKLSDDLIPKFSGGLGNLPKLPNKKRPENDHK